MTGIPVPPPILADQVLEKYRYENCAVVAIGEGGVLIGEQIAVKLHCVLMMSMAVTP